ncbi:MAG: hypothetical protein ACK5U8_32460, partial [Deltaproteobacteria bacterium]
MRRNLIAVVIALVGLVPAAHVPQALAQQVRTSAPAPSAPAPSAPHRLSEYGGVPPRGSRRRGTCPVRRPPSSPP